MKKITLLAACFAAFAMNAQVTVWEDSFEDYPDFEIAAIGDYTLIDGDMDPTYGSGDYDFVNEGYTGVGIVFNPSLATADPTGTQTGTADMNPNFAARTGDKLMYFIAGDGSVSGTIVNDDYFITPAIDLTGASGGTTFSFWAHSLTDAFGLEKFEILLSTTGTAVADFTEDLSGGVITAPIGDFSEFSYDITAYEGETVYVALHYVAEDSFILLLDDMAVEAGEVILGVNEQAFANFDFFVSNEQLNLSAANAMSNVTVYTILGQQVADQKLNGTNGTVNIAALSTGVYVAKVSIDGAVKTIKFAKK